MMEIHLIVKQSIPMMGVQGQYTIIHLFEFNDRFAKLYTIPSSNQEGIYTPPSGGNADKWTYPNSVDFY